MRLSRVRQAHDRLNASAVVGLALSADPARSHPECAQIIAGSAPLQWRSCSSGARTSSGRGNPRPEEVRAPHERHWSGALPAHDRRAAAFVVFGHDPDRLELSRLHELRHDDGQHRARRLPPVRHLRRRVLDQRRLHPAARQRSRPRCSPATGARARRRWPSSTPRAPCGRPSAPPRTTTTRCGPISPTSTPSCWATRRAATATSPRPSRAPSGRP